MFRLLLTFFSLLLFSCSETDKNQIVTYRLAKEADINTPLANSLPFRWEKPSSWISAPEEGMKKVRFFPSLSEKDTEIYAVFLPGPYGQKQDNLKRWCGQIALLPPSSETLTRCQSTLRTKMGTMSLFEIENPDNGQALLIASFPFQEGSWFFKILGSSSVLKREKKQFISLLHSLEPLS